MVKKWFKSIAISVVSVFILSYVLISQKIMRDLYELTNKGEDVGNLMGIITIDGLLNQTIIGSLIIGTIVGIIIYNSFIKKKREHHQKPLNLPKN